MSDREKISSLAQAMSPRNRISMLVRTIMLSKSLNPDHLNNAITAMVMHAFGAGMTSAIEDDDPMHSPQERLNEYMKAKPISKGE